MNIQEAKETIEKALRAYFARDEAGNLLVPLRQQRPILLIGRRASEKRQLWSRSQKSAVWGLLPTR